MMLAESHCQLGIRLRVEAKQHEASQGFGLLQASCAVRPKPTMILVYRSILMI